MIDVFVLGFSESGDEHGRATAGDSTENLSESQSRIVTETRSS